MVSYGINEYQMERPTTRYYVFRNGNNTSRVSETPAEAAERRALAGDFAKGIGLGLTTDIAGLAGDLPALLLSDAPKFAAAHLD